MTALKPLVVSEQVVVHTNATPAPILPHQPIASEQDHQPQSTTLADQVDLTRHRTTDNDRLRDFTQEQIALLSNRYNFTRQK